MPCRHLSYVETENDLLQRLVDNDRTMSLAAELGDMLVKENSELKLYLGSIEDEYATRMEELKQEKHNLQREMNNREMDYDFRLQELNEDLKTLRKELDVTKKDLQLQKKSAQTTLEDNNSLLGEVERLKSLNKQLMHPVQSFTEPICSTYSSTLNGQATNSPSVIENKYTEEVERLKNTIKDITSRYQVLEESLKCVLIDGEISDVEIASTLRHQMEVCQKELKLARKKNRWLKEQLEDCLRIQPQTNVSLLDEMDFSVSELDIDATFQDNPLGDTIKNTFNDMSYDKVMRYEQKIFQKLLEVRKILSHESNDVDVELRQINTNLVISLLNELIASSNTFNLLDQNQDGRLTFDVKTMEREELEMYANDLKIHLEVAAFKLEKFGRDVTSIQMNIGERDNGFEVKAKQSSCKCREMSETDDGKIDAILKSVFAQRDNALKAEEKMKRDYEIISKENEELTKLLLSAGEQKLKLSIEVEKGQNDIDNLIADRYNKVAGLDNLRVRQWRSFPKFFGVAR